MAQYTTELDNAYKYLVDKDDTELIKIEYILSAVDHNLRSDDANLDWDDAYDVLYYINPRHIAGLDYLYRMVCDTGINNQNDSYAREWAIKAICQIGDTTATTINLLRTLTNDSNRGVRNEAKRALKMLLRS